MILLELSIPPSVVNIPQLVGTLDGLMPTYNWSDYLDDHTLKTALNSIKKNHHFKFTSSSPGAVFIKKASGGNKKEIQLLQEIGSHFTITFSIWYYYKAYYKSGSGDKIKEYITDGKDLVCPKPLQSNNPYHNILHNLFIHVYFTIHSCMVQLKCNLILAGGKHAGNITRTRVPIQILLRVYWKYSSRNVTFTCRFYRAWDEHSSRVAK